MYQEGDAREKVDLFFNVSNFPHLDQTVLLISPWWDGVKTISNCAYKMTPPRRNSFIRTDPDAGFETLKNRNNDSGGVRE